MKRFYIIMLYYIIINLTHVNKMLVIISHYNRFKRLQISYDHVKPENRNVNNIIKIYMYIKYYRKYSFTTNIQQKKNKKDYFCKEYYFHKI